MSTAPSQNGRKKYFLRSKIHCTRTPHETWGSKVQMYRIAACKLGAKVQMYRNAPYQNGRKGTLYQNAPSQSGRKGTGNEGKTRRQRQAVCRFDGGGMEGNGKDALAEEERANGNDRRTDKAAGSWTTG